VGAVLGTAALVEGLAARLQGAVGEGAAVALTGGYAEIVSPHLLIEHEVFPDLVLEGAALIWEHNAGEG
jgi:type III pantothenate kinase